MGAVGQEEKEELGGRDTHTCPHGEMEAWTHLSSNLRCACYPQNPLLRAREGIPGLPSAHACGVVEVFPRAHQNGHPTGTRA